MRFLVLFLILVITNIANAENVVHTIQPGEGMSHISDKYNVKIKDIVAANSGIDAGKTMVGQKLVIPMDKAVGKVKAIAQTSTAIAKPTANQAKDLKTKTTETLPKKDVIHTVAKGESLSVLADKYKVFKKDIMALNGMTSEVVRLGQKIKIPLGGIAVSEAAKQVEPEVKNDADEIVATAPTANKIATSQGGQKKFSCPTDAKYCKYSLVDNGKGAKYDSNGNTLNAISVCNGVILYVGNSVSALKTLVIVKCDATYTLLYGALSSVKVNKGDAVSIGGIIGQYNNEMSFFIRKNGEFDNPTLYLE